MMLAMNARDLVIKRLGRRARQFPDLGPDPIDPSDLAEADTRDAALARAIDQIVARRWLTLTAVIQHCLNRPWDNVQAPLQGALLAGAAQLLLLDRIPDHAAVNESVNQVKRTAGAKSGGFVNAVLRRLSALRGDIVDVHDPERRDELALGDGRALRLTEDVLAEDPVRRLAQQTSHPGALIAHWISVFGQATTQQLARHNLVQPPIIVTGGLSPSEHVRPHNEAGFFVFTGRRDELPRTLASSPHARVQDPAAAQAVAATTSLSPSLIVDVCAGRGTKTGQLASVHPNARIVASDTNDERRATLAERFAASEQVQVVEPPELANFNGQADLVVLDVPCSNTGVLARRVEARYRFSPADQQSLIDVQRQIFADSILLLSTDAHVLYTTCSLEAAENQQQVEWAREWHRMSQVAVGARMPRGQPGDDDSGYADGGFHAILRGGR